MIQNELPATGLLGSVGADVVTPAFSCFVSTCRSVFSRSCSSLVLEGTPPTKLRARIFWAGKPDREGRIARHIALTMLLDKAGNDGHSLTAAVEIACRSADTQGLIKRAEW